MSSSSDEITEDSLDAHDYAALVKSLRSSLNQALQGKSDVVEMVIACLLARGHLLFDDLPGLGKTTLAKAVAQAVGGHFARIQCTPDLLPSDVTGFNIFNQKTREFEFREGPVFSDVLLADEINRATPRTQSALFEAMAERQVTIDSHPFPLSDSFFVIATQNPVESHGAFPLPEAQLDRFGMKLRIGYPDRSSELEMLAANVGVDASKSSPTHAILERWQLRRLQEHVASIGIADSLQQYLVDLAAATRLRSDVTLGLSPRGLLTWQRVAQARAFLEGREYVIPDDVQHVAEPVLEVRLAGDFDDPGHTIAEVLESVEVPVFDTPSNRSRFFTFGAHNDRAK